MSLTNFGQQFAVKTLRKFYQTAVTPAITNTNYEGEIKKAGDRVNILSFLNDITISDYVAGTDMTTEAIVDAQDQLVVEKRKFYNFPIDRLEDLFTYADDISDTLVENAAKVLERQIDAYVLQNVQFAKAGSWVGIPIRMIGNGSDTGASVATTATGGTITISIGSVNGDGTIENPVDGVNYYGGFTSADLGLPIRLSSGTTWATEWYRISAVTNSTTVSVLNWDEAASGSDIPNGDVLRGLAGGMDFTDQFNGDGKPTTQSGWGFEIQAAVPTTLTSSNVYNAITDVAEKLNNNEIPDTDRHLTVTPYVYKVIEQASQLQPTGVEAIYTENIVNARVARVQGFDIHMAAGTRVSTRVGHSTASGQGADVALTTGSAGSQILANHISFCTFAYKWAESRIVDAENQFAKKYQGLHLWGAKVPAMRRKAGAMLYATSG